MHIKTILLSTLALFTAVATASPLPFPGGGDSDSLAEAIETLNARYKTFTTHAAIFNSALAKWRPYCNTTDKQKVDEYLEELEDIKHNVGLMIEQGKRDIEEGEERGDGDVEVKLAHALDPIRESASQVAKMHLEFGNMISLRKLHGWGR